MKHEKFMSPRFKVEAVDIDGPHAYVRASIVNPQSFALSGSSTLGGVRLSVKEFFEPSPGVFLFRLRDAADAPSLRVGSTVDFET